MRSQDIDEGWAGHIVALLVRYALDVDPEELARIVERFTSQGVIEGISWTGESLVVQLRDYGAVEITLELEGPIPEPGEPRVPKLRDRQVERAYAARQKRAERLGG